MGGQKAWIAAVATLMLAGAPAWAENYENTSAFKSAFRAAIDSGKSEKFAKIYANGFAEGKKAGLTDSRARIYADAYMRAFNGARENGKSIRDAEAYASDYAGKELRGR